MRPSAFYFGHRANRLTSAGGTPERSKFCFVSRGLRLAADAPVLFLLKMAMDLFGFLLYNNTRMKTGKWPKTESFVDRLRGFLCKNAGFASRHRFAGRFLRSLVNIPEDERTLSPATATVTIGDFHCMNYAFDGDEISAFYDFDRIQLGSPAQDLTYGFIRRFRKSGLSRGAKMENLKDRFMQMVNAGVYFPDDLA